MDAKQAWQSVLMQLQMDMPRASFDTWVRDAETVSLEEGVLIVRTRDAFARDWLESRLTSTVQRLLVGILNQSVLVQFVATETPTEEPEATDDEQEVAIEPVQWLDYEKIVQPHKQVVVKGYLRRLGAEIGPKAIWLYIGFHQAAWMAHEAGKESGTALRSQEVRRFSGLTNGAFWRLMKQPTIQRHLTGLVERLDPPQNRRFWRGRDGRPHRAPIRYRVFMTPRLTRADAAAVHARLKELRNRAGTLFDALQELLNTEDVVGLLSPPESGHANIPFTTVMDIVRTLAGETLPPDLDHLAQELHRTLVNSLGDIHITHYFISEVIQQFGLTPAQAWLTTVARDMAYLNWRTGERREMVTFQNGYREMAELVGSRRPKTVQAWFYPGWRAQRRGGEIGRFLMEVEPSDSHTYADLRWETMPRSFRVSLDEPLDPDGSNKAGASGSIRLDANGSNRQTRMGVLADANGSNMVDANGTVKSTLKHSLSTHRANTSTTQHAQKTAAGAGAPEFWELETLLEQNDVHPKVQRALLESQASVRAFVSWLLYVASPQSGNLSDPLGYAISRLREHPLREARGIFRQLANLPPAELLELIDATPSRPYELPPLIQHPLARAWKKVMGSHNRRLPAVRAILFGKGGLE